MLSSPRISNREIKNNERRAVEFHQDQQQRAAMPKSKRQCRSATAGFVNQQRIRLTHLSDSGVTPVPEDQLKEIDREVVAGAVLDVGIRATDSPAARIESCERFLGPELWEKLSKKVEKKIEEQLALNPNYAGARHFSPAEVEGAFYLQLLCKQRSTCHIKDLHKEFKQAGVVKLSWNKLSTILTVALLDSELISDTFL